MYRSACGLRSYPAAVSTSPVSPEDIRAAAEVHKELGPEYSDAVVASFLDEVEAAIAARVEVRLAAARAPVVREHRHPLLTGLALGACAGALVTMAGVAHVSADHFRQDYQFQVPGGHYQLLPFYKTGQGDHVVVPPAAPTQP